MYGHSNKVIIVFCIAVFEMWVLRDNLAMMLSWGLYKVCSAPYVMGEMQLPMWESVMISNQQATRLRLANIKTSSHAHYLGLNSIKLQYCCAKTNSALGGPSSSSSVSALHAGKITDFTANDKSCLQSATAQEVPSSTDKYYSNWKERWAAKRSQDVSYCTLCTGTEKWEDCPINYWN